MAFDHKPISILIVDDVPQKLVAMRVLLEPLGRVVEARSGIEALRHLLNEDFAVILLDVNMPDLDGFETAALIRDRKRSESTPIIFVTADSDETHATRGYSLGAVDYILAPVIPEVLRAKVGVFVDLFRKNEQLKEQMEQRVALAEEQAARVVAEAATRRSAFLAEASNLLGRSLDYTATCKSILQLVVPLHADMAAFSTIDERGEIQQTDVAKVDPAGGSCNQFVIDAKDLPNEFTSLIVRATTDGQNNGFKHAESTPSQFTITPFAGLQFSAMLCLPLVARGRKLGTLTLGLYDSQRLLDTSLMEDLVGRAAIAIDNARLYREIQLGDRRKDEFLAMLGHELRNPLAAMSTAIECLEICAEDTTIRADSQAVLHRQIHQMTRLVDDLLDISRITRGKIKLRKQSVDLAAVVQRAIATTSPAIAARRHKLDVSLPANPVTLFADPTRLEQIVANLLHNAAKYTEPEGQIQLTAASENGRATIRVRDNGIGISKDLLSSVFELFTQGDRALDRSQGGLGIGLTLVKSLVELHGGEVSVSSAGVRQGSEFVVRLPIQQHATEPVPDKPSLRYPTVSTARRVLIVDDNPDLATTTALLLRNAGHEVQLAYDGVEALEVAAQWKPDAMLIDIGLPKMNGYELARQLRGLENFQQTLLVAITGYGQQEDRQRSSDAGFDCHLVKPVGRQQLEEVLCAPQPLSCEPQHVA